MKVYFWNCCFGCRLPCCVYGEVPIQTIWVLECHRVWSWRTKQDLHPVDFQSRRSVSKTRLWGSSETRRSSNSPNASMQTSILDSVLRCCRDYSAMRVYIKNAELRTASWTWDNFSQGRYYWWRHSERHGNILTGAALKKSSREYKRLMTRRAKLYEQKALYSAGMFDADRLACVPHNYLAAERAHGLTASCYLIEWRNSGSQALIIFGTTRRTASSTMSWIDWCIIKRTVARIQGPILVRIPEMCFPWLRPV